MVPEAALFRLKAIEERCFLSCFPIIRFAADVIEPGAFLGPAQAQKGGSDEKRRCRVPAF